MPSFRNAKSQVKHIIQQKLGINTARHIEKENKSKQKIHSLGTKRNYTQALERITKWIQENKLGDLKNLTSEKAIHYLELRGQTVGQKTLDQERQAMQLLLNTTLPVIKSELTQVLKSRAYTEIQVNLITQGQTNKYKLATQIAYSSGLRAHELLTLRKQSERSASKHREWSGNRFYGREGQVYTVIGKGGLIREVIIPNALAEQLEKFRSSNLMIIKDRNIFYKSYYNIGGGKDWSSSFSSASKRILTWSHGGHGLRHTYAQQRMNELQQIGFRYEKALGIVSQELGHFRPDITEVYLR
jgi:integrase